MKRYTSALIPWVLMTSVCCNEATYQSFAATTRQAMLHGNCLITEKVARNARSIDPRLAAYSLTVVRCQQPLVFAVEEGIHTFTDRVVLRTRRVQANDERGPCETFTVLTDRYTKTLRGSHPCREDQLTRVTDEVKAILRNQPAYAMSQYYQ
jgi:hypothetical protein